MLPVQREGIHIALDGPVHAPESADGAVARAVVVLVAPGSAVHGAMARLFNTRSDFSIPVRSVWMSLALLLLAVPVLVPATLALADPPEEDPVLWSADMLVVDYETGVIGAGSSDLFSHKAGSADLEAKWLFYNAPGRQLRLAFTDIVPGDGDLTLQVGDMAVEFPAGDSSFTWHDVAAVNWTDGQTIPARVVRGTHTPATGAPVIQGTARAGKTLTADISAISDVNGLNNAVFSYRWMASDGSADTDIEGAADWTYQLPTADVGKTIKVRVSFIDDNGFLEILTSEPTAAVGEHINTPATGVPVISGTAQARRTLTADISGITDVDGMSSTVFSYQWIRNDGNADTDIDGEKDPTHRLTSADVGKTIRVRVSFTDDWNTGESLTSAATLAVEAHINVLPTGAPVINGTVRAGRTLTADTTGITDANGLTNPVFSYQWIANDGNGDTDIVDATDPAYELSAADIGQTIMVRVSFTDDGDTRESLTSAATLAVGDHINSLPAGAPVISGTTEQGETLTADTLGITDIDGLTNAAFSYQWIRNGDTDGDTDITDATDPTYELASADLDRTIKVRVSFTDDWDTGETLTSEPTGVITLPDNFSPNGLPTISGTAKVGKTLTADVSGIADPDGLDSAEFSFQWVRSHYGNDFSDIEGATSSTYALVRG